MHRSPTVRAWYVLAWLMVLASPAGLAEESLFRVTCAGMFKLSVTEASGQCAEDDMLTDPAGGLMSAFSAAIADLPGARLIAGAAGGAIRNVGYIGREASSLMLQNYRLEGDWRGTLPITIRTRIRYGFSGNGRSRAVVTLRSSTTGNARGSNRAGVRLTHTEFGGAILEPLDATGNYGQPGEGSYPSRSSIELSVYEQVPSTDVNLAVRVDLFVYALPSLTSFDTSVSSVANFELHVELEAPCPVTAYARDGQLDATVIPAPASDDWQCGEGLAGTDAGTRADHDNTRANLARIASPEMTP